MSSTEVDLKRCEEAQAETFEHALAEIRSGRKRTHWMWFVFPQVQGLGSSVTARRFAIRNWKEAAAFLDHPILGTNYRTAVDAVWQQVVAEGTAVGRLFPYPDDLKLVSSLTLFIPVAHSFPIGGYAEDRWMMRAEALLEAAYAEGYGRCAVTERFVALRRDPAEGGASRS